jgi:hypothetical protein
MSHTKKEEHGRKTEEKLWEDTDRWQRLGC